MVEANPAYLLEDNNMFALTEYKVLNGRKRRHLIKCSKVLFNGKIQFVYLVSGYRALSGLIETISPEELCIIITNLIKAIIDTEEIGFLKCNNQMCIRDSVGAGESLQFYIHGVTEASDKGAENDAYQIKVKGVTEASPLNVYVGGNKISTTVSDVSYTAGTENDGNGVISVSQEWANKQTSWIAISLGGEAVLTDSQKTEIKTAISDNVQSNLESVSYTHLDVYKRQMSSCSSRIRGCSSLR